MIRYCPNCKTERPLSEFFCEGTLPAEETCNWDLSGVLIQASGASEIAIPVPVQQSAHLRSCPNGHPVEHGDLICMTCGADVVEGEAGETLAAAPEGSAQEAAATATTRIGNWVVQARLPSPSAVREWFTVQRDHDGREGVLELFATGSEPDQAVHETLAGLSRDHLPEIYEFGRWKNQAFEVREIISGGTLASLGTSRTEIEEIRAVAVEAAAALVSLSQVGLRHRDIRPDNILVRTRDPLDLVLSDFGSARLSEYDLDIVAPLETTRYMAPEAIAGGVSAASDWWSLGMVLLELATRGRCFEGINPQAVLIGILTNGVDVPEDIDPSLRTLLRGLLVRDHRARWQADQVRRWIAGEEVELPTEAVREGNTSARDGRAAIALGGKQYLSAYAYSLAAAEPGNWDEARSQTARGVVTTWVQDADLDASVQAAVRRLAHTEGLSDDFRLSLILKILHPSMPLVVKGNIVTPGWLLDHPIEATQFVFGPAAEFLSRLEVEDWILRLRQRGDTVRARARQFEIALNEEEVQIHLLSTSKARLATLWAEKRRLFPDTDHPGLNSLLERRQTTEEDLILLLSAEVSQFRSRDVILDEAEETAARAQVSQFSRAQAQELLALSRRDIHRTVEDRIDGFARCGVSRVDEWADQFRLDRRIHLDRALVLLSIAESDWQEPPKQTYVSTLLEYFSKKIAGSILRGPLTRMSIGKTTPRVDLVELDTARRPAKALLEHILARTDRSESLDPAAFGASETLERRLRSLHQHSLLYKRDTGIDGLYLGFPFLIHREDRAKPKIAPILLWPLKLVPEVGNRGHATLAFDREREEVRLNPAFEGLIGIEASRKWQEAANDLLGRSTLSTADVVDGFSGLAEPLGRTLVPLPGKDADAEFGRPRISCAATLFHLAYMGQAIVEDLRQLKGRPLDGTGLETALKVTEPEVRTTDQPVVPEAERYFTVASDPSQEAAVLEARQAPGLLVEGPPGTGKSQTIVNMVADAIGRKKSLLVVCQKQAALEVVKKRLEAEGLEDRIFMITDMNRDREPVIKAIRDQVEAHRTGYGSQTWRRDRLLTAQRIEGLEADLNRHHEAVHQEDPLSGLSYRGLLGELLQLEGDQPPLNAPALRRLLGPMTAEELFAIEDAIGQNARVWLPAKYEGNALQPLKVFQPDPATIEAFVSDLASFRNSENQRLAVYLRTDGALPMEEPEPYKLWYGEHDTEFRNLDDDERNELARWMDLCRRVGTAESKAEVVRKTLMEAFAQLERPSAPEPRSNYSEAATAQPDNELDRAVELARRVTSKASFFGVMNPMRWKRKRELRDLLATLSLDTKRPDVFLSAVLWEQWLRPVRLRIVAALRVLGEDALVKPTTSVRELSAIVSLRGSAVAKAQELSDAAATYPNPSRLSEALKTGTLVEYMALRHSVEQAYERYEAKQFSRAALANTEQWFEPQWISDRGLVIDQDGTNAQEIGRIAESTLLIDPYQRFRLRLPAIPAKALEAFNVLRGIGDALSNLPVHQLEQDVRRIIRREALLATKMRLETETPSLLYEAAETENKVRALAEADVQMRRANRTLLTKGVDFSRVASEREWEPITRLRGQRAQRLREFLEKAADLGLMELRPVWLMNPDVASRVLPLRQGLFDIVIYDEASQMPVEYSLPTLYRGQIVVVSGDEKQMPPTSFFSSKVENDEADAFDGEEIEEDATDAEREIYNETWNRREIKDCPDLLQLAKSVLPTTTLQIHYRSAYRELIGFSNASFYANRLSVPVRHPDEEVRRAKPIDVIRVDGVYENQTNAAEARKVVETLAEIWRRAGKTPTVGVVTFNRKQADLIEEILEDEAERDAWFGGMLARERDRIEGGEDVGFFVKNVENVQGDERDYIVFSSTFGRNPQGTFRRNFGVLGQKGGERRLNVAVTRAKTKVIMITSIPVADVSDMLSARRRPATPRDYLQGYLEYARAMSAGELDSGRGLLGRLVTERGGTQRSDDAFFDGFASSVGNYLTELGVRAEPVSDGSAFGLDFAIEHPDTGLYALAVECDAPRHRILASARAREVWRPLVLGRSIPHVHRVTCHGWYHAQEEEKRRLRIAVQAALCQEAAE